MSDILKDGQIVWFARVIVTATTKSLRKIIKPQKVKIDLNTYETYIRVLNSKDKCIAMIYSPTDIDWTYLNRSGIFTTEKEATNAYNTKIRNAVDYITSSSEEKIKILKSKLI